ncbi:hypothetical protein MHK_005637, partial [Candidatus Magnetomorum sp. HK-1]
QSDAAHVTINIIAIDDPPTVANSLPEINTIEDSSSKEYDLSTVFTDVDNENSLIQYQVNSISNPDLLTASVSNQTLKIDFYANKNGSADFYVTAISNGKTVQSQCHVNVSPVQDAPVANNIIIQTLESTSISYQLEAFD